jgi:Mce-associated membrane protein
MIGVGPRKLSRRRDGAAEASETQGEVAPLDTELDRVKPLEECPSIGEQATRPAAERIRWRRIFCYRIAPAVALVLTLSAAYFKYEDGTVADAEHARIESVQAATEGAVALLSYTPDTVEAKLTAARDLLTGPFRDSYASLTNDVVIPGAKQRLISATASVPAAAAVSTSARHAVVLVFVNQSVSIGADAPSETASAVEVVLDKAGSRWLISGFEPK